MTSRERMIAAYRGEAVDRAPIWLREGFPILEGPAEADNFAYGWQADPLLCAHLRIAQGPPFPGGKRA